MQHILVAYASPHGSTREVAEAVAARVREDHLEVDAAPVEDIDDIESYDGVVLGAALYMGHVHKDARSFLRRRERSLAAMPVAVFGMGPRTLADSDVESSRQQLDRALAAVPLVDPFAITVFGGVVDPAQLRFPFNRMPASDARDWRAIEAWADRVAGRFSGRIGAVAA